MAPSHDPTIRFKGVQRSYFCIASIEQFPLQLFVLGLPPGYDADVDADTGVTGLGYKDPHVRGIYQSDPVIHAISIKRD